MTLITIFLGTLIAGVGSVWLAAALLRVGLNRPQINTQSLLSLAAGALLATAFMHLLPEAFELQFKQQNDQNVHHLFNTLLIGIVFFFLMDKAQLWHHGHEHHHKNHSHDEHNEHHQKHAHVHAHTAKKSSGWILLTGDSVHCFGDGLLIASAFMVDIHLGWVSAVAVLAHEVPHHIGDLVVLRQVSDSRQTALWKVSLAGTVTTLGGVIGYFLLAQFGNAQPYFLAIASSSFIYVALADLIPQLQKRLSFSQTMIQILWLLLGIICVSLPSLLVLHSH